MFCGLFSVLSLITFHILALLMWKDYMSCSFVCAAADTEIRVRNCMKDIAAGQSSLELTWIYDKGLRALTP